MKHMSMGDIVVNKSEEADCIFVNTCCVTKKAAADSRKMIRKYQRETQATVIGMGCWPSAMLEDTLEVLKADEILTNDAKFEMLDYRSLDLQNVDQKPLLGERQRTRAFVKVQDGCFNQCAFCLTTIARGLPKSVQIEDILNYIKKLEALETKEIVLTGVQLGSWGKDLAPKQHLSHLIELILENSNIPRIRLSSIEPWDVDETLISLFDEPRLCSHLHIPVQSASDDVLRAMRRPISKAKLLDLFQMIKFRMSNLALSSDILLGFPGESDQDFQETLAFIRESGVSGGHVFSFSPMPGTYAATMPNQVQQSVVKDRNQLARKLLSELGSSYQKKRLKTTDDVLFESRLRIDDIVYQSGLSKDMLRVFVKSEKNLKNSIHRVELETINSKGQLFGKLVTA
jgi:threonylcarbamoyladenosine tRNA methylthiotransferase MtaB